MADIFHNSTMTVPKQDEQIVRVSMRQNEIAGRTDHLPTGEKPNALGIQHVGRKGA